MRKISSEIPLSVSCMNPEMRTAAWEIKLKHLRNKNNIFKIYFVNIDLIGIKLIRRAI